MTGHDDGSFAIELEGTFQTFGYAEERDEMSRASELIDEIENRVVALRDKLWGVPPEVQARMDRIEAENESLRRHLNLVAQELVRLASKGHD